ncbi:MAG: cupin domain-containing protein [bacterium]
MIERSFAAWAGDQGAAALSALGVVESLGLEPHREGGYFRETYRAAATVATAAGPRPLSTAILYLLTRDDPSRFHRLRWDEMWFFHRGAWAELVLLGPGPAPGQPHPEKCRPERHVLGPACPHLVVPAGRWLGARVLPDGEKGGGRGEGGDWALVSCVVSPGFEYDDFEPADRESLLKEFPQARTSILALT